MMTTYDTRYKQTGEQHGFEFTCVGNINLLEDDNCTRFNVTGDRRPWSNVEREAEQAVEAMLHHKYPVLVTGGARGAEACAVRHAVKVGIPVAVVLGTGVDKCCPEKHERLHETVLEANGALVSIFPDDREPRPAQFVQRSELVAKMTDILVVCACKRRSGAMLLAQNNKELGANVYAYVQGHEESCNGNNYLIRDGVAEMIASYADLKAITKPVKGVVSI
tara:strand:- start:119 stop:781 length:663 start_codon:yes stop_codon:yes gene_type:complete